MIDSETFFARYLASPRLQQTQSDQRLISLNAAQIRLSPERKIKSSFLQEEISFQSKSTHLLSQTIKSLLKSSQDLVETIRDKNLIDPQLQYHLRKFKNDHESVNDFLAKRVFDNLEQLGVFKEQIQQLQSEISILNDKCKHRKECLKKLNDILDKKDKQILQLKSYQGLEVIFQALGEVEYYQEKLNQLSKSLSAEQIQEIIQRVKATLTQDLENSRQFSSLQLKYNCDNLGEYIDSQFQLIDNLSIEIDQMNGLKQQVQQCTELLEQQELEIEQLSSQLNENIKVVEMTRAQLTQKSQENDVLSQKCTQQGQEITGKQVEINQYIKEIEDLQSAMQQFKVKGEHQIEYYIKQHHLIQNCLEDSNLKLLHITEQNEKYREDFKQITRENDGLKQNLIELESNIADLTQTLLQSTLQYQINLEELNHKIADLLKENNQIKDFRDQEQFTQSNLINQLQKENLQQKQHANRQEIQIQQLQESNIFQKNEIDEFKSQIQNLQDIIKKQNEQIQYSVQKQSELVGQLAQKQKECTELNGKLEFQLHYSQTQQDLIQNRLDDSNSKLLNASQQNEQHIKELNKITFQNDELKQNVIDLKLNIARLTQQQEQSTHQFQIYREEQNNKVLHLVKEKNQIEVHKEQQLSTQFNQINQLSEEIQQQKQYFESQIKQLQESNIFQKNEIDEFKSQIQNLQDIIKKQNEQIQYSVQKQSELLGQLAQKQKECTELNDQVGIILQKDVEALSLKEEIKKLINYQNENEHQNQKQKMQLNESMAIIQQGELEKADLQKVNESFAQQLWQVQQQYSALEQSYQKAVYEKNQINQQLHDNSYMLEQSMIQNENKFKKLQIQNQSLKEEINSMTRNQNEKEQQNKQLQMQLNESMTIIKQRELEKDELQKENESINQQIQQIQQQYSVLEQSYQQIEYDKNQMNQQLNDNSHLLEQSMIQNENKFQKLQIQNQSLKEEIAQLKKNQNEKEHQFAQTVKQYHQKHQGKYIEYLDHNTKMSEVNKLLKERNEDITKIKSQLEDTQIKSQLLRMKDETYRRVLGRIIKSIDPFFDTKGLTDIDNLLEIAVEKVQSLIKQNKREMNRNKENEEFSLNSQKELFNLELSQIAQN